MAAQLNSCSRLNSKYSLINSLANLKAPPPYITNLIWLPGGAANICNILIIIKANNKSQSAHKGNSGNLVVGAGRVRFHILALKWQKLENSTAAASRTWFTTIIIGSTASSQVIVMHDANWRRATGKAEAALEAKAEVKLGTGRGKAGAGILLSFP